jgi:hypothetical protein
MYSVISKFIRVVYQTLFARINKRISDQNDSAVKCSSHLVLGRIEAFRRIKFYFVMGIPWLSSLSLHELCNAAFK